MEEIERNFRALKQQLILMVNLIIDKPTVAWLRIVYLVWCAHNDKFYTIFSNRKGSKIPSFEVKILWEMLHCGDATNASELSSATGRDRGTLIKIRDMSEEQMLKVVEARMKEESDTSAL